MKSIPAFRSAVEQALKADPGIASLVVDRVFNFVPSTDTPSPWIYVGGIVATPDPNACGQQWTVQMRVYALSTAFDPDAVWPLLDAIRQALDGQSLPMPDGMAQTLAIAILSVGDVVDPQQPASAFLDLTAMVAG